MSEQENETEQITNAHRLVYFAAERTLMAWVRTVLGLMALGFVIDRFGLVLKQISPATSKIQIPDTYTLWGGDLLVLVGAVMALAATIRYWRFALDYRRKDSTNPGNGIVMGVIFTALIALLGLLIAAFLLSVR